MLQSTRTMSDSPSKKRAISHVADEDAPDDGWREMLDVLSTIPRSKRDSIREAIRQIARGTSGDGYLHLLRAEWMEDRDIALVVSEQVTEIEGHIRAEGRIEWPSDMKGILGVTLTEVEAVWSQCVTSPVCACRPTSPL